MSYELQCLAAIMAPVTTFIVSFVLCAVYGTKFEE